MGNCLERSRGRLGGDVGAADDALHCAATKKRAVQLVEEEEREKKAAAAVTEVKIRITRRQLEELLRRLEAGKEDGAAAAISELLCMSSSCNFRHRPPQWRPSLQSIPE